MENKELSPVQKHVLDLLHVLINVFEKENIHYYMLGGTMLGAVRHRGFIPWDDDVDLGIVREDYERLLASADRLFPDYIKIRTYYDDSYHHYYYARLVDTRYHIRREGSTKTRIEELWIDLFPLDGMPVSRFGMGIQKVRLLWDRLLYHMSTFDKVNLKRPGRPLADRMIIKFLLVTHMGRNLNSKKQLDKIDKLLRANSIDETGYYFNFMGSTHAFRELFTKDVFGTDTKYQFEDMELIGPEKYDTYLRTLYGDYMKLPPISERNVHAESFVEGE